MTLWKCTLESKQFGNTEDKIEYLRSPTDDRLITMFEECERIEGSTYYAWKWTSVEKMSIRDFPEIVTIKVDV